MSHDKKQVKCSREPTPIQLPEALDLPLITNSLKLILNIKQPDSNHDWYLPKPNSSGLSCKIITLLSKFKKLIIYASQIPS